MIVHARWLNVGANDNETPRQDWTFGTEMNVFVGITPGSRSPFQRPGYRYMDSGYIR